MGFLKWLIGLPLAIVVLVFAFVNNDLATFNMWPFYIEITVSWSVAIVFFIVFGFLIGELFAWMSYAPVRKALRHQKKQCRRLTKEQLKLIKEMEDIHKSKEEEDSLPRSSLRERLKKMFTHKSAKTETPVPAAPTNDSNFN